MDAAYLTDSQTDGEAIRLSFYDPSSKKIREIKHSDCHPYFLISHPPNQKAEYTIERIVGTLTTVQKNDLFTGEVRTLAKIEIKDPEDLEKYSRLFETAWESEIEFSRGYVYDHGLVFGAQHTLEGEQAVPLLKIPEEKSVKFKETFADLETTDPSKYDMLEYWFSLLHQPIPWINPQLLGMKEETTPDKYWHAFMLSRIANLPIPIAYSSRRVSEWIKSIIYTYLRRRNFLIPTSKELRRQTKLKRSVEGALTITPQSGTYFHTVVTDFESLYPSCIDSYNLSYETIDCQHKECSDNTLSGLDHHVCTKRRGFYSVLVGALKDLRIHWFKPLSKNPTIPKEERHLAEIAEKLLKLITVSSYGVTVRIHGLASTPLAESITAYGRYALQTTWKMAKEKDLRPIYGDTDSIFLDNPSEQGVQRLIKSVKNQLRLDLAVEKQYSLCVLSEAKKAYFGVLEDGTPDIKGLTVIKSNAPIFIQHTFRSCIKELSQVRNEQDLKVAKRKIVEIVRNAIRDLRERKFKLKDLEFSVKLYFDPKEKLESKGPLPQPYQCAVQLIDSGRDVKKRDTVSFIKVNPFNYRGKHFTVKATAHVKSRSEVNVEDYVRNLRTALGQTFRPMNIQLEAEKDAKLWEWFD